MQVATPRRAAALAALGLTLGCAHPTVVAAPPPPADAAPPATVVVTGSRIPQRVDPATGRPHAGAAVRIYTPGDLARTGAPDLGKALRRLEPGGT